MMAQHLMNRTKVYKERNERRDLYAMLLGWRKCRSGYIKSSKLQFYKRLKQDIHHIGHWSSNELLTRSGVQVSSSTSTVGPLSTALSP